MVSTGDVSRPIVGKANKNPGRCAGLQHTVAAVRASPFALKYKSEAVEAWDMCVAFFNSIGCPIVMVISDCAPDLKSGGVARRAAEDKIRLCTTTPGGKNTNAIEPYFRIAGSGVRRLKQQGNLTGLIDYRDAYDYAFDYWQDGQANKSSGHCAGLQHTGRTGRG